MERESVGLVNNRNRYVENPYWAVTEVRRYPFVPPKVCIKSYYNISSSLAKGILTGHRGDRRRSLSSTENLGKIYGVSEETSQRLLGRAERRGCFMPLELLITERESTSGNIVQIRPGPDLV